MVRFTYTPMTERSSHGRVAIRTPTSVSDSCRDDYHSGDPRCLRRTGRTRLVTIIATPPVISSRNEVFKNNVNPSRPGVRYTGHQL
ncbi:hypothetical protein AVEN_166265-1 [Araneus ventricosus]|uniref:Uncharacterized protein n=1 Tax=Araneus ventricosus TaxID=182803 RepID=A0A4Y2IRE3_ARAVE|nr:hypothetical protein AVEN_166265-1 [Araneus ventricosus]